MINIHCKGKRVPTELWRVKQAQTQNAWHLQANVLLLLSYVSEHASTRYGLVDTRMRTQGLPLQLKYDLDLYSYNLHTNGQRCWPATHPCFQNSLHGPVTSPPLLIRGQLLDAAGSLSSSLSLPFSTLLQAWGLLVIALQRLLLSRSQVFGAPLFGLARSLSS